MFTDDRKLGELLVGECRLPSPDLVFYLKHWELGQLVSTPSPALLAKWVVTTAHHLLMLFMSYVITNRIGGEFP